MSDKLKTLGEKFNTAREQWAGMPPGEARDDACEELNRQAAAIRSVPARDLAGLAVKARAAAWTCSLDLAHPDDPSALAVAALVADVQKLAGAA